MQGGGRWQNEADFMAKQCVLGREGVMSKRLGSRYVSGRTRDWPRTRRRRR
jgi:ATP-dependent DNA ligase